MSSNLLKAYHVIGKQDDVRVIHNNELIEEKLERIRLVLPNIEETVGGLQDEEFYEGLDADELAGLMEDNEYEDNNSNIIKREPEPEPEPVYHGPTPEELIENAKEEIERMKARAIEELDGWRKMALDEARKAGYAEGLEKAKEEELKMVQNYEEKKVLLQKQYEQNLDDLEPKFIEVLTEIYEKIFEVDLSAHQGIVLSLLQNTMRKIDGCKNFLVHVSKEDFSFVNENKESLLTESNQADTAIDIIEDATLNKNGCMIETINGIFDCGLDTQLSELKKKLKILSYGET